MTDQEFDPIESLAAHEPEHVVVRALSTPKYTMETRKNRTPSARMLAAKEDDVIAKATPISKHGGSASTPMRTIPADDSMASPEHIADKEHTPIDEEIDVSNADLDDSPSKEIDLHSLDLLKEGKIDSTILSGAFPVANEVTISSMKYSSRPVQRKNVYDSPKAGLFHSQAHAQAHAQAQAQANFTGETLNLKDSDLSVPNKAAHFLYFRCYDESDVQKEFPLTIDESRKGQQNFLVEPRVGLKNTDYYIDSYLWNRGKSTSSKKKIFVEIDGNHVKTSRRSIDTAHYLLNWYYSNMESRICKKVCWLENISDGNRASPVLVQYHVNYVSDMPIELRKTPKLYSDTRTVAQELLRSDSPLQTVQRFVETGETDPREIINKKQAYEMRRYVLSNARRKAMGIGSRKRDFDDTGLYYDDHDLFEEVQFNEYGEPTANLRQREQNEARRIAGLACRYAVRNMENRIVSTLENRLGPQKNQMAVLVSEWMNTLESVTAEDYDIIIHNVVGSMRKQLEELVGGEDFVEVPSSSGKRRVHDEAGTSSKQPRFEGERYIFEGEEYVEEEVIAEDVVEEEVVPSTSANGESSSEAKYDRADGSTFFFPPRGSTAQRDVTVDQ